MPGCTVPNCTNSSQKGFKLHRFPSDKERKSIWVQNCGRERGWKPTKHTCVCEVHFEESQFESHRADGLRKLKPNAIPTIFSNLPHIRSYTRKPKKDINNESALISSECAEMKLTSVPAKVPVEANMEEVDNQLNEKIKGPDHTYPKFLVIEDKVENCNGDSATTEEVFINVSVASKPDESRTGTPGKERKLQPVKGLGKKGDEWTLKTCQNRKRGRPPDSNGQFHNSTDKKMIKLTVSDEEIQIQEETEKMSSSNLKCRSKETSNGEQKQCFVCGKVVDKGLSLFTLTNTTKVYMYQKLDKILTGEMDLLFKEEGILCSRCANLLNYMDRIEVELNMLKKAILNCIRKKCGMEFKSDKPQENLVATVEEGETNDQLSNANLETKSKTEFGHQSTHEENNENCVRNTVDSSQNVQETSVESPSPEEIVCQVCKFKSIYKSVMFFHLRQHLKEVYWCDFCNTPLSDDAVSWIEKDDDNSVFGLSASGDDEIEAALTEQEEEIHTSVMNNSNISLDNPDLLIKVVPVSDDDTITSKIVEAVACRNYSADESSIVRDTNIQCLENVGPRKNTKSIRVLNEMGRIVMQEVPISENSEIVKQIDENVSQASEFSRLSFQSKPVELQLLEAKVSELSYDEEEINRSTQRVKSYQIINEMGMIVLTEGEERQLFINSDIGSEPNELRVNLTPNLLTYSNERRLSVPVKDGETNDNVFRR